MGEGTLSEEEIQALLRGVEEVQPETFESVAKTAGAEQLTEIDRAELSELMHKLVQPSTTILQTLTGKTIGFSSIFVDIVDMARLQSETPGGGVLITFHIGGVVSGDGYYILPTATSLAIANPILAQEGNTEITELVVSSLTEAMAQVLGSMITTLSQEIGRTVSVTPPSSKYYTNINTAGIQPATYTRITFNYTIDNKPIKMYMLLPLNLVKNLISLYSARKAMRGTTGGGVGTAITGAEITPGTAVVKPVQFEGLSQVAVEGQQNLSLLLDVPMQVTVELGRTKKTIRDILSWGEGSIIELDKLAGEPVDILINGKLLARGEVVVIDENFGVRITEIVNPIEKVFKEST